MNTLGTVLACFFTVIGLGLVIIHEWPAATMVWMATAVVLWILKLIEELKKEALRKDIQKEL